jgi:hypothetical protein
MTKTMKVEGPLHVVCQCDKCKAQPEQEPVAWIHKETGLLRREISRPKGADWDANYWQPLYATTQPAKWDKPSASFNEWWDGDIMPPANPFAEGSAAYWAWAGWQAAQRPWVGLTDEEFLEACQIAERGNYMVAFQRIQTKLKERNT